MPTLSAIEQPKIKIPRVTPQISKKRDYSEANRKSKLKRARAKKLVERPGFQKEIIDQYGLSKETVEKACKFFKNQPLGQFPETAQGIEELSKKYDERGLYIRKYALETGRVKPFPAPNKEGSLAPNQKLKPITSKPETQSATISKSDIRSTVVSIPVQIPEVSEEEQAPKKMRISYLID